MTNHEELERRLRAFDHEPGEESKDAVMRAFDRPRSRAPLWRRRFPAYEMAALLVVAGALSFIAGRHAGPTREPAGTSSAPPDTIALEWARAQADMLRAD